MSDETLSPEDVQALRKCATIAVTARGNWLYPEERSAVDSVLSIADRFDPPTKAPWERVSELTGVKDEAWCRRVADAATEGMVSRWDVQKVVNLSWHAEPVDASARSGWKAAMAYLRKELGLK